jgi:hypothetical protein
MSTQTHQPIAPPEGKAHVLLSPGYGAAWSAEVDSAEVRHFMTTHPGLIAALQQSSPEEPLSKHHPAVQQFVAEFVAAFGEDELPYLGGMRDLRVELVDKGRPFFISEYDGSEWIQYVDQLPTMTL